MRKSSKQHGYIFIVLLVILIIGSTAYFTIQFQNVRAQLFIEQRYHKLDRLNLLKSRLLQYVVLHHELYLTDKNQHLKPLHVVSSPGLFPCPVLKDSDHNEVINASDVTASVCSSDGFGELVVGFMPSGIQKRKFHFLSSLSSPILLVVDTDFVFDNQKTEFSTQQAVSNQASLSLNGVTGYVALIVDAGLPQNLSGSSSVNQVLYRPASSASSVFNQAESVEPNLQGYLDPLFADEALTLPETHSNVKSVVNENMDFYSEGKGHYGVNDVIVGIHYSEWLSAVKNRICFQVDLKVVEPEDVPYWFNAHHLEHNPNGKNWRSLVGEGLCAS